MSPEEISQMDGERIPIIPGTGAHNFDYSRIAQPSIITKPKQR
jgi:hypothetical protein